MPRVRRDISKAAARPRRPVARLRARRSARLIFGRTNGCPKLRRNSPRKRAVRDRWAPSTSCSGKEITSTIPSLAPDRRWLRRCLRTLRLPGVLSYGGNGWSPTSTTSVYIPRGKFLFPGVTTGYYRLPSGGMAQAAEEEEEEERTGRGGGGPGVIKPGTS